MSNLITAEEAGSLIDSMRADIAPLMSESGKSFDRLKSVFLIAIQQEPKILQCTPESLRREISKCAADGLVPDAKEAVLLPYYDTKERQFLANYQPMVLGIIKRMKELGNVFSIVCKLVYANDEFVLDEADPDSISHKSDPFAKDRGDVVGGYVIFRDDKKRLMHLETMSLEDFEKVRAASKAPDSPAWKNWTEEMYKKAVLRRGAKYISINNDKIRALLERQDEMFDFRESRRRETNRFDPFTGEVIEGQVADDSKQLTHQHTEQAGVVTSGGEKEKVPADAPKDDERAPASSQGRKASASDKKPATKQEGKKVEKPAGPPTVPEVMVDRDEHELIVECVEKILEVGLRMDLNPVQRQDTLISAADHWSGKVPGHLKPLVKACIDMTNWTIKRSIAEEAWTGDHAMFVHKVRDLLDVEKLNIGKYP